MGIQAFGGSKKIFRPASRHPHGGVSIGISISQIWNIPDGVMRTRLQKAC